MTNTSDLICTKCSHRNVCKNIDNYKKVIDAIRSVSIPNAREGSIIYITNIDWLTNIDPKCKHYQTEPSNKKFLDKR